MDGIDPSKDAPLRARTESRFRLADGHSGEDERRLKRALALE